MLTFVRSLFRQITRLVEIVLFDAAWMEPHDCFRCDTCQRLIPHAYLVDGRCEECFAMEKLEQEAAAMADTYIKLPLPRSEHDNPTAYGVCTCGCSTDRNGDCCLIDDCVFPLCEGCQKPLVNGELLLCQACGEDMEKAFADIEYERVFGPSKTVRFYGDVTSEVEPCWREVPSNS